MNPYASIAIPLYNEERNLEPLWKRLEPILSMIDGETEVVFVDDGSSDRSLELLRELTERHAAVRVISFNRNYGQHAAVMAGLEASRGDVVITLDADLQNPPEDILKLLAKIEEGFDVVGGWREGRGDTWFRRKSSRLTNRLTSRMLGVELHDFGCMLRAYRREVVDCMVACPERSTFIPALACKFGRRIIEIPVGHADRPDGDTSRYSLWKLLKLATDLVTGFSTFPLRLATVFGIGVAIVSLAFGGYLAIRRLVIGPEIEGVFTLFAILFLILGANFLALGILGEYVGRIYDEVRGRPRSVVRETINLNEEPAPDMTGTKGSDLAKRSGSRVAPTKKKKKKKKKKRRLGV